jgi:hypothetical protein
MQPWTEEVSMSSKTIFALLACGPLLATPAAAAQRWGSAPAPESGVCFYQLPNYRGQHFCAQTGADLPAIPNGLNDRIGSIRVFGGAHVVVYSDRRFGGTERWIDYNVPDLQGDGWYERIGSARLSWEPQYAGRDNDYSQGRPRGTSGYYPGQPNYGGNRGDNSRYQDNRSGYGPMTRAEAQDIVRSAYLNVLGREPDPASASWVDHVLKEHWSQQQLENELRKSSEYRSNNSVR